MSILIILCLFCRILFEFYTVLQNDKLFTLFNQFFIGYVKTIQAINECKDSIELLITYDIIKYVFFILFNYPVLSFLLLLFKKIEFLRYLSNKKNNIMNHSYKNRSLLKYYED